MEKKGIENIKFFIIVPIYNVESYLKECLDSIIHQTYTEFEAILIDDGSTDSSGEIAKEYARKDSRLILIQQENQGLSMARNKGLDVVRQKYLIPPPQQESHSTTHNTPHKSYIVFVDSDDYLEESALMRMYQHISLETDLQCLVFNSAFHFGASGKQLVENIFFDSGYKRKVYDSKSILCVNPHIHYYAVWLFVYRCDLIFDNKCFFEPHIYYEDVLFASYIFTFMKRFKMVDEAVYCYRVQRQDSIMTTKSRAKSLHSAFSHFMIAKRFCEYSLQAQDEQIRGYLLHWGAFYIKETLREIQPFGYIAELGFTKADLKPFLPYIKGKYRFCYHFPRIYGFPKRLRLAFQALWERLVVGKV